ncbi:glycosyltransferase [Ectothiorhodospira haloalkaliphila]|uniref:Glycosyltransferase n=1 Tax=Ectothiorhodospira haloalkaliphila TaxID=421628 RepID=W8KW45_9GAMM|nr:glycosyltransferase [Ectothiorhodospira haloalkaliphila]
MPPPAPPKREDENTSRPLVSVVIPTHNAERFIGEAIDSALDQDYPHKEIIVVDDGSTDQTLDIARSYQDRITLIAQANQGAAVARNAGLDAAQGEFIAFLDSDDLWLPGKLTAQVHHLLRHPEIDLVFSRWRVWKPDPDEEFSMPSDEFLASSDDPTKDSPDIVPEKSGWLYNQLLFTSALHTITVMARRRLIERVGPFDVELKRGQDYDYWIRASRHTQIHQLDRVFALYRLHGNGCAKKWPHENYERIVVEKALARWGLVGPNGERTEPKAIKKRLAETSFSFGYRHYWEGDPMLALRAFWHAARNQPEALANWRYLAMSLVKSKWGQP